MCWEANIWILVAFEKEKEVLRIYFQNFKKNLHLKKKLNAFLLPLHVIVKVLNYSTEVKSLH